MRNNNGAEYIIADDFPGALSLIDADTSKTITNDVDVVLETLKKTYGDLSKYKIMYRDSMGFYDEIVHDNGRFVRFAPLRETDANIAYQKLMRKKIEG